MPLPESFRRAEREYARLKGEFEAGGLTADQFEAALHGLMVEHAGRYWAIGAESGRWHAYDGQAWVVATPPAATPAGAATGGASRQGGAGRPVRPALALAAVLAVLVGAPRQGGAGRLVRPALALAAILAVLVVGCAPGIVPGLVPALVVPVRALLRPAPSPTPPPSPTAPPRATAPVVPAGPGPAATNIPAPTRAPGAPATTGPAVAGAPIAACGRALGAGLFARWTQLGGEQGILGCPIADEQEASPSPQGTTGRYAEFSAGNGGYLFWHRTGPRAGQVFEVHGCIFAHYKSLGGHTSRLGFPISDERNAPEGRRSDFEGGFILWEANTRLCRAVYSP